MQTVPLRDSLHEFAHNVLSVKKKMQKFLFLYGIYLK